MKPVQTIAVVEDDEDDFFFTQRALRRHTSAAILHLPSGWEAVGYLAGAGKYGDRTKYPLPDVMLVDLKMDHGTGYDVLRAIRRQPGTAQPRIYVLTGSNEQRDRDLVLHSGVAEGYVVKPLTSEHALRIVSGRL